MVLVDAFRVTAAPRRMDLVPVVGDMQPNAYFSGYELSSSTQSAVLISKRVLIVVPFIGETVKFPPHGTRPAYTVISSWSKRPYLSVATNLKV